MIRSRKYQFVLALISVFVVTAVLVAKPSEDDIKLKFEISNKKSQLWLGGRPIQPGQGPIKPTHVAIFHIRRPHGDMPLSNEGILQILKTLAGQTLSQKQQQFLSTSDAIVWLGIEDIKNYDTVYLYAVSQEDAKKTVQAYFEVPTNKANAKMQEYENYLKEKKGKIIEIKKVLPQKQKQADEMEPKYKEIRKTRYFAFSNNEVREQAKETLLEMDKMLDVLKIELAGIREKMSVISEYRKTPQNAQDWAQRKRLPDGMISKLDQMFVEQTIELKSAEAREQAAIKIRNRDKAFIDLHVQWIELSSEVRSLKGNLKDSERRVQEIEETLTNPEWYFLPPEIYQNKVTIYPVLIK